MKIGWTTAATSNSYLRNKSLLEKKHIDVFHVIFSYLTEESFFLFPMLGLRFEGPNRGLVAVHVFASIHIQYPMYVLFKGFPSIRAPN